MKAWKASATGFNINGNTAKRPDPVFKTQKQQKSKRLFSKLHKERTNPHTAHRTEYLRTFQDKSSYVFIGIEPYLFTWGANGTTCALLKDDLLGSNSEAVLDRELISAFSTSYNQPSVHTVHQTLPWQ